MNTIHRILSTAFAALLVLRGRTRQHALSNNAAGVHSRGRITRENATTALTNLRHYFVKRGADALKMTVVTAITDVPLGPCTDEPLVGDLGNVDLLGCVDGTIRGIASGTVADGEELLVQSDGSVDSVANSTTGTYWNVGRALGAAVSGQVVEIQHRAPVEETIA